MTHPLLLLSPPSAHRERRVGGLTLLGRAIRVGRAASGEGLRLGLRDEAEREAATKEDAPVTALPLAEALAGDGPLVVVFAEVVVDRRLIEALAKAEVADDALVTIDASTGPSRAHLVGAAARRALLAEALASLEAFEAWASARPIARLAPVFDSPTYVERVVDDASASAAERALFLSCIKPIDGLVSRHLNRKISLRMSRLLVDTGVTPNQVSVFCMGLALLAAGFATLASNWALALAGTFFQLNSIVDGVDGELARVKWQFSKLGERLDSIGDDVSNFSYFGALVYAAFARGETRLAWIGVAGLAMWAFYVVFLWLSLRGTGRGDVMVVSQQAMGESEGFWEKAIGVARLLLRRDGFVFLSFLFAITGYATHALVIIFFGSLSTFVFALRETARRLFGGAGAA